MVKRKLAEFEPLTKAEQTLLDGLDSGEVVEIGPGTLPPEGAGEERIIHAEFLRYLILGACNGLTKAGHCLHEKGLQVRGALITGILDLEACRIETDLCLFNCRFEQPPLMRGAQLRSFSLSGSYLPGLNADGLVAIGDVFLRQVISTGEIRLIGAKLGGGLECNGASLMAGDNGDALSADRLVAGGSIYLNKVESNGQIRLPAVKLGGGLYCDGATLVAGKSGNTLFADRLVTGGSVFLNGIDSMGDIRLVGAKLGGDLACGGAKLMAVGYERSLSAENIEVGGHVFLRHMCSNGEIRLVGAKLGGILYCDGAMMASGKSKKYALNLQTADIKGALDFRGIKQLSGGLSLLGARVNNIVDTPDTWPESGKLFLDRCRYDGFLGGSPVSGAARIEWLSRQDRSQEGEKFQPQPWEQCARVLHDMGYEDAAREVLIEKEKRQHQAKLKEGDGTGRVMAWLAAVIVLAGITWESSTLVWWLVLAGGAAILAMLTMPWGRNLMLNGLIAFGHKPRRAFWWLAFLWFLGGMVFLAAADQGQVKPNNVRAVMSADWVSCAGSENPVSCFAATQSGVSYPRFNAWIYSADTLLPIVDLEVQNYWIPAEEAGAMGTFARWYLWFQIASGWALSLLAVAGFSGLIRHR